MAADFYNDKNIERYLLGDLPEEQQIEIEDRAFQDKEYLANITAVENDLIDEYVREELSQADRRLFESRFLASAARRKRVEFARAMAKLDAQEATETARVAAAPAHELPWYASFAAFVRGLAPAAQFALAAALLLLLIGGGWLMVETMRLRSELNQLQARDQSQPNDRKALQQQLEAERRRSEELAAQLNQERQQREHVDESLRQLSETGEAANPPKPIIATLTLLPGISRGGGVKPKLALPDDAHLVRLQIGIDPEETYKSFAVELSTAGGRHVWSREKLTARTVRRSRAIGLSIPATAIKAGEYELRLKGVTDAGTEEDVGFYYFTVTRK